MVTREQFCRFSLHGRLRLLGLYGRLVHETISQNQGVGIFEFNGYWVVVKKDIVRDTVLSAEPVHSKETIYKI